MYEQQIQQLQQQIQAVEQGIVEISSLNLGLDDLKNKTGKEILASVGKGIFAEAKLTSENLIVDIGEKNFVKKTIPETQEIIKEQIKKLQMVKEEMNENLESISEEIRDIVKGFRKE